MRISLFFKIFGLSLVVLGISLGLGTLLLERSMLLETRRQIESDNILLVRELSRGLALPLLKKDRLAIEDNLGVFEHTKGVLDIRVYDRNGTLAEHLSPHHRTEPSQRKQSGFSRGTGNPSDISFTAIPSSHLFRLRAPVRFQKIPVGAVELSVSDASYREVKRKILQTFLLLGGGSALLALAGSLFLGAFISRPVRDLRNATERLGKGDFTPVPPPLLADETSDLVLAFNRMAEGILHKDLLEKALVRYVSRDVAESLIGRPELIHLGGARQEAVILFCDIRNFTRLSSRLSPEEVVEVLNSYFDAFIDLVFRYRGSVNNIMGDGLMIVFGIPEFLPDHPELAIECALSMRESIQALSEERLKEGKPHVEFGFGLHVGSGILGNIGSRSRMEYTIVGETVNLASRIEQEAAPGEILLSDLLWERIPERSRPESSVSRTFLPKGIDRPIRIYAI